MAETINGVPIAELGRDAAAVIKRVQTLREPLVITDEGRVAAIILSLETYERAEREREMLRLLLRGEREIAAGEGYNLDDVLREADALLTDQSSAGTP